MLQIILEKVGVKVFFCVSMHITLLFQFKSKLQFIFLSLNSLKSALQAVISFILIVTLRQVLTFYYYYYYLQINKLKLREV